MNPDGKAHCFDPPGRVDVKYEEYGHEDAPEQWNENGSIWRARDDVESEFDEDVAEDEDQKEEEEDECNKSKGALFAEGCMPASMANTEDRERRNH